MAVSLFISNNYINAVQGSGAKGSVSVRKCVKAPIQEGLLINGMIMNEDLLSDAVKNVWADNPELAKSVRLIVDSTAVLSKRLRVPVENDKKLLEIIKDEYSEVENYDKLLYDYRVLNPKARDGGMDILSCAVEREFIEGYISLFDKAGIKLEAVNTALSSIIDAAAFCKKLSRKTYVIANLDGNNLSNTLFVDGDYNYSSRSRLLEEVGSEDSADEMYRIFSSLVQFNKSQKTGFDITDVFFTGDIPQNVSALSSELSSALGVNVSEMPALDSVTLPDHDMCSKLFTVLGNLS